MIMVLTTLRSVLPIPTFIAYASIFRTVTLGFVAADSLSGLLPISVQSPLLLTTEGSFVTSTVTVSDIAGNTATFTSPSVNIDKTPPATRSGTLTPAANSAGWNNTTVVA